MRSTEVAQLALHLRREERVLHRAIMEAPDLDSRVAAVGAACKLRSQILDVVGWPTRPPGSKAGKELTINLPTQSIPIDAPDLLHPDDSQKS